MTEIYDPKPKARASAVIYAENRLAVWAKWAKENREHIGYPTISLLYKAMQSTKLGVIRKAAYPYMKNGEIVYLISADGHESRSMRPDTVEAPEAVAEVDEVVAHLPPDLHEVIVADYFTYGPIEVRCKKTRWRRARFSQLLECAKYAVFCSLASRTKTVI